MGAYQKYRGDSESKLFYLIDDLYGGINTEYSDDVSQNGEFRQVLNFNLDKRGCLVKRKGFGKLSALSQILSILGIENLPEVRLKTEDYQHPEDTNDNIVYMKLLRNDNNCFRNLSAFNQDKGYRKYQEMYGFQDNSFELLMITTNLYYNKSTAWLIKCELPELETDEHGEITDEETIVVSVEEEPLKVVFPWDRNLINIDTFEYFNKIYFLENNNGIMVYNRDSETLSEGISYSGFYIYDEDTETYELENGAYKPTGLEVANIGFNVLGGDATKSPLYWIDTSDLITGSIQGVVLLAENGAPLRHIPYSTNFKVAVIYTGTDPEDTDIFTITMKSSIDGTSYTNDVQITATYNETLSVANSLAVYDVVMPVVTENYIEIKVEKVGATIDPLYTYYSVSNTDFEDKPVERLSLSGYKVVLFNSRALYYKGNMLWFSDINNFTYIPHYNRVELPLEPTDEIVKIVFFRNVYIIFTKYKIYKIYGTDLFSEDFSVTILNDSLGCCASNTVVPIENVLYFASNRGLYMLTSTYAYSTGSSVVTFENLKELDDKVKKLTSEYTYYVGKLDDPSVNYNGVSEKAVALRYKDNYMLFYNTSFEKGDYAAENGIDVLNYNYELKAFTTTRFTSKPTFLFLVDNAIQTFATYKNRIQPTGETTVIDYDFTTRQSQIIEDLSGNGYNAEIVGDAACSEGAGVTLDGEDSYIEVETITKEIEDGLDITLELDADVNSDCIVMDLSQNELSTDRQTRGTITSEVVNDHYSEISYVATPNHITGECLVEYTVKLFRTTTDFTLTNVCNITLLEDNVKKLIDLQNVSYQFGEGDTEITVTTGTFTLSDISNYIHNWKLDFLTQYETTKIVWEGTKKSGSVNRTTKEISWSKISYSWVAVPGNGSTKVTVSNVKFYWEYALYVSKKTLAITVNGTKLTFAIPAISGESVGWVSSTTTSKSVTINYTGSKSVTVKTSYPLQATITGYGYIETLNLDNWTLALPTLTQREVTEYIDLLLTGNDNISLEPVEDINGVLKIDYNYTSDTIVVNISNDDGGDLTLTTQSGVGFSGKHLWKIHLKDSASSYITKDNQEIGFTCEGDLLIKSFYRDKNYIGCNDNKEEKFKGTISEFSIYTGDTPICVYAFKEGTGTTIYDSSNGIQADLIDCVWESTGYCELRGGYLNITPLPITVNFENGFEVIVDMELDDNEQISKLFDFAKTYNTKEGSNNKCSINVGVGNMFSSLNSTGLNGKKFSATSNELDLTQRHTYSYKVEDNGSGYNIIFKVDGVVVETDVTTAEYKSISNVSRLSNFIGRSNDPDEDNLRCKLYSFELKTASGGTLTYSPSLFEYDTTYNEFDNPMEILIETKGYNLAYPQHIKKLKKVFIKCIGGYNLEELFFIVYCDGKQMNVPGRYVATIDEEGTVIYEFVEDENFILEPSASKLDSMVLSETGLYEQIYQIEKFSIPAKGKNFSLKFYGTSSDSMELSSIGMVCKLGKVKK